jgi:hypothetical protein
MGAVTDLFEDSLSSPSVDISMPPEKNFDTKLTAAETIPSRDPAYKILKRGKLSSLEKKLFDLTYSTLSYLAVKYEDDDDLNRDITQTRSDAIEAVLKNKFEVKDLATARANRLSIKVAKNLDVELLQRREDA